MYIYYFYIYIYIFVFCYLSHIFSFWQNVSGKQVTSHQHNTLIVGYGPAVYYHGLCVCVCVC